MLANGGELVATPGDQLVWIGLVTGVKYDLIARRIEHVVQGKSELDDAEIAAEMPPDFGNDVDDPRADFFRELGELIAIQLADVSGSIDRVEESRHGCGDRPGRPG